MKRNAARPELLDRIAGQCIASRVRFINRIVTAVYEEALRPHGVRVSQANILVAVAHGSGAKAGARPADVCQVLRLEKSTLSRDVEIIKRAGWIESDPPTGGRNQRLRVTSQGMELLRATLPAWEQAQAEATRLIGAADVEAVHRVAARLGFGAAAD